MLKCTGEAWGRLAYRFLHGRACWNCASLINLTYDVGNFIPTKFIPTPGTESLWTEAFIWTDVSKILLPEILKLSSPSQYPSELQF